MVLPRRGSVEPLHIRPMQEADVPTVFTLERRAYPRPWSPVLFRRLLRGHADCRVLEQDGRVVGYGIMLLHGHWMHLLNLNIAQVQRHRGLGRRLLVRLLAEAREAGAHGVWLEVRPTGQAARRLYRSLGFRQVGRRRHYYREPGVSLDALLMIKQLR